MAKKKAAHSNQDKPLQKQEDFVKARQDMDSEASEKIDSLKSLNQMLVKEAVERRHQVDSLIQSKGSLEMELTRSNSESEALKSELTQLCENAVKLELERTVVAAFVSTQVGAKGEMMESRMKGLEEEMRELKRVFNEKESEIERLNGRLNEVDGAFRNEKDISKRIRSERDEMKDKLDQQIEEAKGLRQNFVELEVRKKAVEQEIGELRDMVGVVLGEKEKSEMRVESLTSEKDLIERSLLESNKLIEGIKEELGRVVNEKKGIEEEKNVEAFKRKELEKKVCHVNELVFALQKDEQKLRANVAELEKKCIAGEEMHMEMGREIDKLVEEKKLNEKKIEELIDMKSEIEKDFNNGLKRLDEQKRDIEKLGNEKMIMMEAKSRVDSEVVALQKEGVELKAVVLKLEESYRAEMAKLKSLESEVGKYKSKIEEVKAERDKMGTYLDEEKVNSVKLKEKIGELENKVEESFKAIEETKGNNAAIFAEKIELESQCEMLKKEINSLGDMLKETLSFCTKDDIDVDRKKEINDDEDAKGYLMDMEMIKNAFKSKESKVEGMKRQVELLQSYVEDAHKKKSFWTALSSATTLLAAISLAYVARGH